jgi:predicted aspartyl protease
MRTRRGWRPFALVGTAVVMAGAPLLATATLPEDGFDGVLELAGGRPALQVLVNGEGPFTFVLDTGATSSLVDAALSERLGLPVVGRQRIGAPGLEGVEVQIVNVEAIEFDGVVVRGEGFLAMDLAEMTGGAFVGVLGLGALADVTVTLDFAAGRLGLDRQPLDPQAVGVIEMAPSPIVEFPIRVGGRSFPAHLDTGSPGELTFPRELVEDLELLREPVEVGRARLVGGESAVWSAQLAANVQVGGIELVQPEIHILDLDLPAVNVGSGLLSRMVVRIDQGRRLVQLTSADAEPARAASMASPAAVQRGVRFGLQVAPGPPNANGLPLVDGGLPVAGADAGSRAEASGLIRGDVVLEIAGQRVEALDGMTLRSLLASPGAFGLVVRRGDTRLELEVPAVQPAPSSQPSPASSRTGAARPLPSRRPGQARYARRRGRPSPNRDLRRGAPLRGRARSPSDGARARGGPCAPSSGVAAR